MNHQINDSWVVLSPPFPELGKARAAFLEHASLLSKLLAAGQEGDENFDTSLKGILLNFDEFEYATSLRAVLCLLNDLARQRWSIRVTDVGEVAVKRPTGDQLNPIQEKARVRSQELVKRDEQLREPATRRFIKGMESKKAFGRQFVSIYSLMRDGRELADSLRTTSDLPRSDRVRVLKEVISPYLQFVDGDGLCEQTGLRLQDIWRYFRHTWTNPYMSAPGRSMAFLVRDRAREFSPVIGIGSIGSPIVQIRERDEWIGWHPDTFMEVVSESPSIEFGMWLNKIVENALGEMLIDDFIEEQLLTPADIRTPNKEVVSRLSEYSVKQRELHHRLAIYQDLKRSQTRDALTHWPERSLSHLFRSKRALLLAEMLDSRIVLQKYLSTPPSIETVRSLLGSTEGRQIVKKVLRKARADRVGIAMADITVCGAIAPYNLLLGGKLVSLLAASPEVVAAYRDKYVEQESEIASSMAGRPIVRPSELVFFSTTSLYGVGSSQYNRIQMPADRIGGSRGEKFAYIELGKSEAYGTSHFSSDTVEALVTLVQQSKNGQRVNSIFGEGVSPKFRKIRQGLDLLNLPTDSLLQHGRQRIIYGVPVARNYRDFLLGVDDEPEYIFDMSIPKKGTEEIAHWWTERWLSKRIESDNVLSNIQRHTLVQPIRHGARVLLPPHENAQLSLFDDLSY